MRLAEPAGSRLPSAAIVGSVGQPRRMVEERARPAGDGRDLARDGVGDEDVTALEEVVIGAPVGDEGDPPAVRRPGRGRFGRAAGGQPARGARRDVDDPQVLDAVVGEAFAVEHVVEPVDVADVGFGRLMDVAVDCPPAPPRVLRVRRRVGGRRDDQRVAIRRPLERRHAAWQVGQAARLATIEREQVDLGAVLAIGRLIGPVRLLFDDRTPIRQEREGPAVR